MKIKLFLLPILFALLAFPAFAKEDAPGQVISQEKREAAQLKQDEARLGSCEAKEASIMRRAQSLGNLVGNMIEKFEAITARVMEFYETKVQPDVTVENYDDLIADIDAKKGVAQTALEEAQDTIGEFTCDSDDPRSLLTEYKEKMQAVKTALREYRASIKNLIVAVHTALEEEPEEEETDE